GLLSVFLLKPLVWKRPSGIRRPPAARTVARMAGRLQRLGVEVPESATVGWIGRQSAKQWPTAGRDVERMVSLAEQELYGADRPAGSHLRNVRLTWKRIRKGLR
ncbi:MAG: hypothetical protein ABFS37_14995, partial [Acidobacteriota bacterium]